VKTNLNPDPGFQPHPSLQLSGECPTNGQVLVTSLPPGTLSPHSHLAYLTGLSPIPHWVRFLEFQPFAIYVFKMTQGTMALRRIEMNAAQLQ
jgi:hypothetical protein